MIAIIDSGGANIASIIFALARLGFSAQLSRDPQVIQQASHVILPGVGAAATGMARLKHYGLLELIPTLTQPVLGICLGMQLLYQRSAEGDVPCLKLIPAEVAKFATAPYRVPHMGWNTLQFVTQHPLTNNVPEQAYVYYTHSYYAPVTTATLAITAYGVKFSAIVAKNNFFGMQFHPERSGAIGAKLLQNFLEL